MKYSISLLLGLAALVQGAYQEELVVGGPAADDSTKDKKGPSPYCMYCKLLDTQASFLYSYSYCADTKTCLQDAWNFPNQWCKSGWVPGYSLDIDKDCKAEDAGIGECPGFVSKPELLGETPQYLTRMLTAGKKCTLTIDASAAPARFTLSKRGDNSFEWDGDLWGKKSLMIGVLRPGYQIGESILIPEGTTEDITIYAAEKSKAT